MVFGLILIAVGVIAILVKTGAVSGSIWDYTWPTILVIIGLSFFLGRFLGPRWWWFGWRRHWHDRSRWDERDKDAPDKKE
jgi:hypothetical protein